MLRHREAEGRGSLSRKAWQSLAVNSAGVSAIGLRRVPLTATAQGSPSCVLGPGCTNWWGGS